jgi:hypothetical protein
MHTLTHCPECREALGDRALFGPSFKARLIGEAKRPGRGVVVTCEQAGHKFRLFVQSPIWALYYDRGLHRVAAEMFRDAILDVYTALEMYLADVPAHARYLAELNADPIKLREETRTAVRLAEPARGAALSALSIVGRCAPPNDWQDLTNLRNDVIHGGRYPSQKDAEEACVEVHRVIDESEAILKKAPNVNNAGFHRAVWFAEIDACRKATPEATREVFTGWATIWDIVEHGEQVTRDPLKRIQEYREPPAATQPATLADVRIF